MHWRLARQESFQNQFTHPYRVQDTGYRVHGYRVHDTGYRIQGTGYTDTGYPVFMNKLSRILFYTLQKYWTVAFFNQKEKPNFLLIK